MLRNGENTSNNLNKVIQDITETQTVSPDLANQFLDIYNRNKNKIIKYTKENLTALRRMLGIETKDRYLGSADIAAIALAAQSAVRNILDTFTPKEESTRSSNHTYHTEKSAIPKESGENASRLEFYGKGIWEGIQLSIEDAKKLAKMALAEAEGEGQLGQRAVLEVILQRVLDGRFGGKTLDGVLNKKSGKNFEFSPKADGRYERMKPTPEIIAMIAQILNSGNAIVKGALFFQSSSIENGWINRTRKFMTQIGNHKFFR